MSNCNADGSPKNISDKQNISTILAEFEKADQSAQEYLETSHSRQKSLIRNTTVENPEQPENNEYNILDPYLIYQPQNLPHQTIHKITL